MESLLLLMGAGLGAIVAWVRVNRIVRRRAGRREVRREITRIEARIRRVA